MAENALFSYSLEAWRTFFVGLQTIAIFLGSLAFSAVQIFNPNYKVKPIMTGMALFSDEMTQVDIAIRNWGLGAGNIEKIEVSRIFTEDIHEEKVEASIDNNKERRLLPLKSRSYRITFLGNNERREVKGKIKDIEVTIYDEKQGVVTRDVRVGHKMWP